MRSEESSMSKSYRNPSWEQSFDVSDTRRPQDIYKPFPFEKGPENLDLQYDLETTEKSLSFKRAQLVSILKSLK